MTNIEFKATLNQVISFLEVEDILNQVRETASTNMKLEILKNNKGNDLLKKVLEYTYNPYKKYGISEKMILTGSLGDDLPPVLDVFTMFDKLAINNINDDLRTEFANFLDYYEIISTLLRQIVNKDLKLGCNINTINKVWKDLVPTSETGVTIKPMLASKFDFDKVPSGEFVVTEKLDGIRCIAICKEDGIELYTRQGKLIEGCVEIEKDLSDLRSYMTTEMIRFRKECKNSFVFDGELLAKDCSYENVYKETTKRVKNKNVVKTGIEFKIFDVLDYEEFSEKKCSTPYYERMDTLVAIDVECVYGLENIDILKPVYIGKDTNRLMMLLNVYKTKGAEGLMVNLLDAPYEFKRSKAILKVKVMQTVDLRIVGFEEGQSKNKNKLGALLVEYKGNIVGVGSGFTDQDREFIWKNKEMYLGRICEIQFFEESKNKDGEVSLRFPVWKHLRLDKTEPSYD